MVENDRISISGNRRTLRITHLTEADTALYSSEVLTTGGLEVTQYWLVVRGRWWSALCISSRNPSSLQRETGGGHSFRVDHYFSDGGGGGGWKILK